MTRPKELLSDWRGLVCCVILTRLTSAASVFWNQMLVRFGPQLNRIINYPGLIHVQAR